MATFALIHGAGSTAWDWHLVSSLLERFGHETVAVDLPTERTDARLPDYVDIVAEAIGGRDSVIVVGHSLGGFTAPLVCERVSGAGLVYLAAMIPLPGESFETWWTATGHDRERLDDEPFFTGVPEELVREATARERDQQGAWLSEPWPGTHPAVPTMVIAGRDDGFFSLDFMRRQARSRLAIDPVEIDGGHYAALGNPAGVADTLDTFARDIRLAP